MTTALDFGQIPARTIGRRLRDAREDTGLSQAQFAEETGLSQRSISRYEQATEDDQVKRPVLVAWALATGVPLVWLQTGVVPPSGDGSSVIHRLIGHAGGFARSAPFLPACTPMWERDLAA